MAKSGITFKFDTKNFEKAIKRNLRKIAQENFPCPNCQTKFSVNEGNNTCPNCKTNINLDLQLK